MQSPNSPLITDEMKEDYRTNGFLILDSVIPSSHLKILRDGCQYAINLADAEMDKDGVDAKGANYRGQRYFVASRHQEISGLTDFLFSELMSGICRALLGESAYLFYEQYVVKGADIGMKFNWHQDSAYVLNAGFAPHQPFITCWCALDDVNEDNGTAYLLPGSATQPIVEHTQDTQSTDLIGYHGDDPGTPVVAPAGTIAVFSSVTLHRTGVNSTKNARRVYVAQYSAQPISDGEKLMAFAEPMFQDEKSISRTS